MKSGEKMGATIIRRGVAAQTKAWCHPHTGGEDRPGTATTKAAKASNSNERGRNETPSASGVDKNKRLLPLLTRVMPMKAQGGGSKKRKVPRQGGGESANPHKRGKAGVAKEGAPAVRKAGVRTSSVPHQEESFRSCVGITLPQHHGEHATQQGCVDWGAGARRG